jgi:hypothetical protein
MECKMNFIAAIQHTTIGYGIRRRTWPSKAILYIDNLHILRWMENEEECKILGVEVTMNLTAEDLTATDWTWCKKEQDDHEIAEPLRHGTTLHHKTVKNADGSPCRCRVTGKCKTWKTRPDEFRLPVKYGLRQSFYIEPRNAHEWETT